MISPCSRQHHLSSSFSSAGRETPGIRHRAGHRSSGVDVCTLVSIVAISVFGAPGCSVDEIRCYRSREFTVDAELTKADVDRLCELRGGFFYEEYVCPGETPPATGEYETYVPECEELCWARQQRFVEEYGTGSLGFPPESVEPPNFEDYDDFFDSSGDGIRRVVTTCTTNVDLDAPLAEAGSIGRIRCSGIEMAVCSYDHY